MPYWKQITSSLILLLFVLGCKSTKTVTKTEEESVDFGKLTAKQVLSSYEDNALSFDDFEVKAKVNYDDGKRDLNVKMTVRIEKDKQIWMSAGLFGFEGVRALITPDSVFVINRIDKTYFREPMSKFEEFTGLPVDFDMLQRLLTAQLLLSSQSSWALEPGKENIKLLSQLGDISTTALFQLADLKLTQQHVIDHLKSRELEIDYSNYQPVGKNEFPYSYSIHVAGEDEIWLDFEIENLELNSKPDFSFQISKSYKREYI